MFNKCNGPLTGWISYTYTHATRTFSAIKQTGHYPASHERPHELNAVATYTLNRHWSFGATFVYASGTPFTAPVSISLIDNNLMMKYGEYNSSRLKPYHRLDLSANYKWQSRRCREQGINLSLYNAIAQENELFYYIKTRDDGSFAYRPVTFMLRILPSISYFCKF
jgi:outer membrane receptor protein involved in Fe transport